MGEARQLLTSAGLRLRLLLRLWSLPTVGGACAVPVLVVSAHGGPPPPPPTSTHQAELPVQPAASNSWPPISTQAFHPPAWCLGRSHLLWGRLTPSSICRNIPCVRYLGFAGKGPLVLSSEEILLYRPAGFLFAYKGIGIPLSVKMMRMKYETRLDQLCKFT